MKTMEQCHTNEIRMMKENQAQLEAKLAMMKSFLGRYLAPKVTIPSGSNRTTNEQVIFLEESKFILLQLGKALVGNNVVLTLFLNRFLIPVVLMK